MLISVITACLNNKDTLKDTLDSVLAQRYAPVEHIIVDGGSTDGTHELLHEYEERYRAAGKTLCWKSEPDGGIYDAMNKGIRRATGDVVGLLNADDFYTSDDVLDKVAATISQSGGDRPVDAVYADIHYVHPRKLTKCVRYYSSRVFRPWKMRMGFMPAHPSFYCRREIYMKYGMFDTSYRIAADFEQLLRLLFIHRINAVYIPADFVTMRTGGASSSGFPSHKRIYMEHRRAYKKNGVYSNFLLESMRYAYKVYEVCRSNLY